MPDRDRRGSDPQTASPLTGMGSGNLGAPTRLCAYYRLDQQELAGWTLIAIAVALGMTWFIAAFIGWTPSCAISPIPQGHKDEWRRGASSTRLSEQGNRSLHETIAPNADWQASAYNYPLDIVTNRTEVHNQESGHTDLANHLSNAWRRCLAPSVPDRSCDHHGGVRR